MSKLYTNHKSSLIAINGIQRTLNTPDRICGLCRYLPIDPHIKSNVDKDHTTEQNSFKNWTEDQLKQNKMLNNNTTKGIN